MATVKLHSSRAGYLLDGEYVEGFEHRPDLPLEAQLKVARWAAQLGFELSPEQEALVAEGRTAPPSVRQTMAAEARAVLENPLVRILWDKLSAEQQEFVLNPASNPDVKEPSYPLTGPDLASLVGCEDYEIRRWSNNRKLPHWRFKDGRDRRFPIAAAILAMAQVGSTQNERQFTTKAVSEHGLDNVARVIGIASLQSAYAGVATRSEMEDFEHDLRRAADGIALLLRYQAERGDEDFLQVVPEGEVTAG